MTQTATSPQRKPILDEASFQQLLAAAYVLQEHNDRLRGKEVQADFAKNLSAIVETQRLIQTLQLDLEAAAKLVAERIRQITNASGAAIGIIEKGELAYRAATGSAAAEAGTRVALGLSLSAECLSQGNAVNYPDALATSHTRAELFRDREVKSFIAVPVYHAGQVAGVLELRFAGVKSFREADLRTAELMAGLLSEAMATAARMKWKDALASERQSMLEALERIKPQLERLGAESPASSASSQPPLREPLPAKTTTPQLTAKSDSSRADATVACAVCGSEFSEKNESFCGICGTARPAIDILSAIQDREIDNVAILSAPEVRNHTASPIITPYESDSAGNGHQRWDVIKDPLAGRKPDTLPASLQELIELSAIQQNAATRLEKHFENHEASFTPPERDFFARRSELRSTNQLQDSIASAASGQAAVGSAATVANEEQALRIVPVELAPASFSPPGGELQPSPWGSARRTQEWLDTVRTRRGPTAEWMGRQWQRRRANIYIGIAALILAIVISRWGIGSSSTAIAGNTSPVVTGRHQAPPGPTLTPFEKLLVSIGLAEAPPTPVYMGNPDTQVWVDVHTALYHCPGSELFGKTPDGRLSTQRDAQQDQFEPANRKACP